MSKTSAVKCHREVVVQSFATPGQMYDLHTMGCWRGCTCRPKCRVQYADLFAFEALAATSQCLFAAQSASSALDRMQDLGTLMPLTEPVNQFQQRCG